MVTTFTGTRMANTATPFVENPFNVRSNDVKTDESEPVVDDTPVTEECVDCIEFDVTPIEEEVPPSNVEVNIFTERMVMQNMAVVTVKLTVIKHC